MYETVKAIKTNQEAVVDISTYFVLTLGLFEHSAVIQRAKGYITQKDKVQRIHVPIDTPFPLNL